MKQSLLALAILALILSSCSSQSDGLELIPDDAHVVVALNVKDIADKANFEEWEDLEFMQAAKDEVESEGRGMKNLLEDVMDDPASMGLDLRKDVHFFVVQSRNHGMSGLTVDMYDSDDFREFMENLFDEMDVDYMEDDIDDYEVLQVDNELIILYDDDKAAFIGATGYMDEDELFEQAEYIATLRDRDQLMEEPSFAAFTEQTEDISAWVNGEIMQDLAGALSYSMRRAVRDSDADFDDYIYQSHLSFLDDDIRLRTTYESEEAEEMLSNYDIFGNSVDGALLDFLPEESIACGGLSLKISEVLDMLDNEKAFREIHSAYRNNDDMKDVVEHLSGDVVFSMFGMDEQEVTYTDYEYVNYDYQEVTKTRTERVPQMAGVIGSDSPEDLYDAIEEFTPGLQDKGDLKLFYEDGVGIYLAYNDEGVIITNSEDLAQDFHDEVEQDDALADADVADPLQDEPMYMHWEIDTDMLIDEDDMRYMGQDEMMAMSLAELFKSLEFHVKDERSTEALLHLEEGDGNSLWQIVQGIDELYQDARAY